jgi:hypothetical protein
MAFHHSPRIVSDGLVFAIDIANSKCYPGSGTSLTDIKGSKTVTLANATIGTGNLGFIDFDGSGDSAALGTGLEMGSTFSWSCFIRMGSISNGGYGYFNAMSEDGVNHQSGYAISEGGTAGGVLSAGQAYYYGGSGASPGTNGNAVRISDHAFQIGVWTHICCTIDNGASSGTIKTYINGVLDRTITSQQSRTFLTHLGWNNGSHYLDGEMAVYLGYNKTLTDAEVLQNYNVMKGRFE